ncbi:MAG: hypothetical protein M3N95_05510 [Actinomycetota bacterium]|nr:hypothetical protein [Actinomycetota bacterium]
MAPDRGLRGDEAIVGRAIVGRAIVGNAVMGEVVMTAGNDPRPLVRFGRRQSKGVLLGLSGVRLATLATAILVMTVGVFAFGIAGLIVSAPAWSGLAAAAFLRWQGRPAIESAGVLAHWAVRVATGQTRFTVRPSALRPAGTMALPGDAAALRFHTEQRTGAVMVHDPHRQTLSAMVHVTHPAYVLLSPDEQARRVTAWSTAIAGLAGSGSCPSVQVLESTLPDPGHGVRAWLSSHGVEDGAWASKEYSALVEQLAPTSFKHRTLISLTVDLKRSASAVRGAGRGIAGAAEVLRRDMSAFEVSLRSADLRIRRWMTAPELAVVIRQAYDPAADAMLHTDAGANLTHAGPVAVDERWDHLRHDGAYSRVLWISEWPRTQVAPDFLHALVFEPGIRKSISVVAKPLATAEALRAIRKEKVEYLTEAQQSSRIGRLTDLSAEQEYGDVITRERALASGHTDLRFSGFICVTAPTHESLIASVASVERAASQCGCETRVLVGQQASAFVVAALPLGRAAR